MSPRSTWIDDAPVGQLGDVFQVRVPLAFGVEQRLVAAGPKLLDDLLQRGPVESLELRRATRNGTQPRCIHRPMGTFLAGSAPDRRHVQQVRRQGLAGRQHLLRLAEHVHAQAPVAAQLVGEDVERAP